jgi:peptidoglycan/LPS O-acetylase OafA/YrhL
LSHSTDPRIGPLDALRGIAALSVVIFHFTTRFDIEHGHTGPLIGYWPVGHYGVQLFFGISGFVIFMTLDRTSRAMDFIVSRFSRLYPAYWAAILLTTAAVMLLGATDYRQPLPVILANLTMVHGLFFIPSVDGVYWTLLVELCFYGWMLVAYLAGWLKRIEWVLLAWIGLTWLWWIFPDLSFRVGVVLVQKHISFFALGMLAFLVHSGRRSLAQVLPLAAFAIVTVFVASGWELGLVALLVASLMFALAKGRLGGLNLRVLTWLGSISYALYLLHEVIGWSLIRRLEAAGVEPHVAILAAAVLSFSLATAVTLVVERPALRWIRKRYRTIQARPSPVPSAA